jgi:uncharacterized protein (TIGR03435 family)
MEATHYEIGRLAHRLHQELDRKVIDLTGLTGFCDLKLEWAPEQNAVPDSDSTRPSIFTAVRTQLGLKLEPRKIPVKVLIVDHVEKPGAN